MFNRVLSYIMVILITCVSSVMSTVPMNTSAIETEITNKSEIELESEKCGSLKVSNTYKDLPIYIGEIDIPSSEVRSLPSYVDLSTDPCFPPLGQQGSLNSCVAFATTYYQFSYEVNKLNGVTSASNRVVYSPKWTYNFINDGTDDGGDMSDAFTVLENYGALKLSDLPYDNNYNWLPGNTNYSSNEMIEERIDALHTRISSLGTCSLPNTGTVINSPSDSDLYVIKSLLNSGKVLTVSTINSFNYKYGVDHNNSTINVNYRCYLNYNSNDGHALAVVGYDDNVWCDVNNNGIAETCEKGAFKCANSLGSVGSNNDTNGYKWILYDALNAVSANNVNLWESNLGGFRVQAFSNNDDEEPVFWYINVDHKSVYYIGEIDINTGTSRLSNCQYSIGRVPHLYTCGGYSDFMLPNKSTASYNGKIFFDYDSYCTPIQTYLNGYDWYVNFYNNQNYDNQHTLVINYNFKVIDDLQNIIATSGTANSNMEKHVNISTKIGDVNLDGILTLLDANQIQAYDAGLVFFSSLQMILADHNQDGLVNLQDYLSIVFAVLGGEVLS